MAVLQLDLCAADGDPTSFWVVVIMTSWGVRRGLPPRFEDVEQAEKWAGKWARRFARQGHEVWLTETAEDDTIDLRTYWPDGTVTEAE